MTPRAVVYDQPQSFTTAIAIVFEPDDPADGERLIMRLDADGHGTSWERVTEGAITEPTLRLPSHLAQTLTQALLDHFHRGEDTRAMRRNYEVICSRLDKLTEAVAQLTGPNRTAATAVPVAASAIPVIADLTGDCEPVSCLSP